MIIWTSLLYPVGLRWPSKYMWPGSCSCWPAHYLHTLQPYPLSPWLNFFLRLSPGSGGGGRVAELVGQCVNLQLNTATGEHQQDSTGKIYRQSALFRQQPQRDFPDWLGWFCRKGVKHFQNIRFLKGCKCCQGMFHFSGVKPTAWDEVIWNKTSLPTSLAGGLSTWRRWWATKPNGGRSGKQGERTVRGRDGVIINLNKP